MKRISLKKVLCMLLCMITVLSLMSMGIVAEETDTADSGYTATNPYVFYYGRRTGYTPIIEQLSPYATTLTYDHVGETYDEITGTITLYNTVKDNEHFPVYCVDEYTRVAQGSYYKRINLEDSEMFGAETAALLRSIVLNGYPFASESELGAAAGVDALTIGEALHATQLAIWQTAYGVDIFHINDFVSAIHASGRSSQVRDYDTYRAEIDSGYATEENIPEISERIIAVFDYLRDLEPTPAARKSVSGSSFVDWSRESTLTENEDGTFNVAVSATIDVDMSEGDALTVTAVLANKSKQIALVDGLQTVDIVIENVPLENAYDDITLSIDGSQTVEDVFLYITDGGREFSQELIGYSAYTLPVHAEVTAKPERKVNFLKTDKIVVGTDADGNEIYEYVPLEGIIFDLYYVADWDDYVYGKVELPDAEDIDITQLGDPEYHNPDFTVVTDENGEATVSLTKNGLPDGVYVVAERPHLAIKEPTPPFYIILPYTSEDGRSFEYELTIKPKNDVKEEIKVIKDINELNRKEDTVDVAVPHTWIITGSIPSDIKDGKKYLFTDTLDNRLDFLGNVRVRVESNDGTEIMAELTEGVDYILSVTDNDSLAEGKPNDYFEANFTKAGMANIAKAVAAGTGSVYDYKVRLYFDARINSNAELATRIPNKTTLIYKNSVGFDFEVESDEPVVYTGGIRIYKVDAEDDTKYLKGAEFSLYRIATADEVADENVEKLTIHGIDAPVVAVKFYTDEARATEPVNTAVTDENGRLLLYGLKYDEGYYLVETKAPTGYNLLGAPVKLTVNDYSHEEAYAVKVENSAGFILPETGGMGTKIFTALGIVMMLGAGVFLFVNKLTKKESKR